MAVVGDILLTPETGWQRIEQDNANIKYKGTWTDLTNASFSSGSAKYSPNYYDNRVSITFYVKTTKLRIVSYANPDYATDNIILIDDEAFTFSLKNAEARAYLCFEKLNLTDSIHKIVIKQSQNGTYQRIYLDAIDIDETGCILVPPKTVGDILTLPETGWKRIDDTDKNIRYTAGWTKYYEPSNWNDNYMYTKLKDNKITFKCYTSNLRIISPVNDNLSEDIEITIDSGDPVIFSEKQNTLIYRVLVFESLNMEKAVHTVSIKTKTDAWSVLDAIDIDEDGYLEVMPSEVGDQLLAPETGWKRYDDTDSRIKYDGSGWITSTNQYLYGGNEHATNGLGDIISFKFYGTKLRILSGTFTNNPDGILISIDGTSYTYNQSGTASYKPQTILFEKLGLDLDIHTVTITCPSSDLYMALDCLDIDDTGYLISSKGDQLLQPEIGWQRFDDTDSKVKYTGAWLYQTGADNYNGGSTIIPVGSTTEEIQSSKCDFYFVGTKLRIINAYYSGSSANYIVEIDGVKNIVTSKKDVLAFQCIIFEKLNLEKTAHHVRIYSGDTDRISLDAFDIDSDGYLITEAEYSQGNKFPVLIGDNTITSETNIANYANSLVNGERQLLISDKLKSIYVTDGQGNYTKLSTAGSENIINDVSTSITTTYSSEKIQEEISKVNNKQVIVDLNSLPTFGKK